MHELGIAQSILETVKSESARRNEAVVHEIGLKIGTLSGVLPDALAFGFEAITAGTSMEKCRLAIEELPAKGKCRECNEEFEVDSFFFICPRCESTSVETVQGFEMEIAYLEIDERESDANGEAG